MTERKIRFTNYKDENYKDVCNFLIELNKKNKEHINWNWARWEWMYYHTDFDKTLMHHIGLWWHEQTIVGAAIYDQYFGEAFCGCLSEWQEILSEIIDYACENLKDDSGLGIAVNDSNKELQKVLLEKGFHKAKQDETILKIRLEEILQYSIPKEHTIKEINLKDDVYQYQWVLWQGFDHGNDKKEFEDQLIYEEVKRPHFRSDLCLVVADKNGNFIAHCNCWIAEETDYAYIEPVCTIPEYRKEGLGKAIVYEALNRCRLLGAKEAYVISDQPFYYNLGFEKQDHYSFWWL